MNRQRAKELLPIIQAFAEGKAVQYMSDDGLGWCEVMEPEWLSIGAYRIKPEPVRVYVATWYDEASAHGVLSVSSTNEKTIRAAYGDRPGFRIDVIEREAP